MSATVSSIMALAKNLNPRYDVEELSDLLTASSTSIADLAALARVLQAEHSRAVLRPDHFAKTVSEKDEFTFERSAFVSRAIGLIYGMPVYESLPDTISVLEQKRGDIAKQLSEWGYVVLKDALPVATCDRIIEAIGKVNFFVRKRLATVRGFKPEKATAVKANTCWVSDQQDVLRIPEIQRIAFDRNLLGIVQEYLGAPPILVQSNCWWSLRYSEDASALSGSAQQFHQDKEFVKFIKVFIYLTDVTDDNGPHMYVAGSARDYTSHVPEGYKMSSRMADEDILDAYLPDRVKTLTGTKGTIIIEDTSGFHKGQPVREGYRLLAQLEYASSLYFNPVIAFSPEGINQDVLAKREDYPRLFENFDAARHRVGTAAAKRKRFQTALRATAVRLKRKIVG